MSSLPPRTGVYQSLIIIERSSIPGPRPAEGPSKCGAKLYVTLPRTLQGVLFIGFAVSCGFIPAETRSSNAPTID
jgi:hypothetical protein